MRISRLDHLVLTVADVERSAAFYRDVLGMRDAPAEPGRRAVAFGPSKINFHQCGDGRPDAKAPTPGSADVCFVLEGATLAEVSAALGVHGVAVEGPVARVGALGSMTSLYLRDPDGNLVELAVYAGEDDD
ncbi:VOC family protein [Actinocorallia sp. A-T 12471]|uniref:VOC family protein n=1 Tax=Actinocorallia sp. A-T 12471 TaxID=3089813 RepID=UPI0029CBEE57|nr:VOC family protein [Actinocorallia sp. A-T 12471]MDX6743843.1 VOC family protein [Actinocorallia sp. A-T 12471]